MLNQDHVFACLAAIMRLPAFFLLEKWLQSSEGEVWSQTYVAAIVFFGATLLMCLHKDQLFELYENIIGFILLTSYMYIVNIQNTNGEKSSGNKTNDKDVYVPNALYVTCVSGLLAAFVFRGKEIKTILIVMSCLPIIIAFLEVPVTVIQYVHYLTYLILLCYLGNLICFTANILILAFNNCVQEIHQWGWSVVFYFVEAFFLQRQLLLYWFVSFAYYSLYYIIMMADANLLHLDWITFLFLCFGECCKTYLSLMATIVALSYASYYARHTLIFYLYGQRMDGINDISYAVIDGIRMFVLIIDNALLDTNSNIKHEDMLNKAHSLQALFLYSSAIFFVDTYKLFDLKILSFGESPFTKGFQHIKALVLYVMFFVSLLYIIYMVHQFVPSVMLTYPILIIGLLSTIEILCSILTYVIFMLDASYCVENLDLDDIIFYIKSPLQVLNYLGNVIIACVGIWSIKNEGLSWIRTTVLVINLCGLVASLQHDWNTLILRRDDRIKIDSIPTATKEKLNSNNDVCPICHQKMSSAKITPCGHLYHRMCLKKWLNVKASCPLCFSNLTD